MILLVKDNCPSCHKVYNLDKEYKGITKFYVEDGKIQLGETSQKIDPRLRKFPILIDDKNYYFGSDCILDYLEGAGEKIAKTNIL